MKIFNLHSSYGFIGFVLIHQENNHQNCSVILFEAIKNSPGNIDFYLNYSASKKYPANTSLTVATKGTLIRACRTICDSTLSYYLSTSDESESVLSFDFKK